PFLNGGLFDPIGNYDWVHTDILLPNKLFSNNSKTKEGDTGDGILDIFDRYNFTVREDEPLEKEVAIDPELLGKAYEKFNAIRPDNYDEFKKALKNGRKGDENKFNKKFGVYYTPREIVHYMCQQSLINYLATELSSVISSEARNLKEDIETLIHISEHLSENEETALIKEQSIKEGKQKTSDYKLQLPESIRSNAALIDQKLADITVCDPAVGSGAFPVGMMSEIVRARNMLSVFLNDNSRTAYEFKRRCIEHSLYGVDIDPGAVEIAKLRLWLSLMVDEEDIRNIKPLPNLDYKIVRGNSLIGFPENWDSPISKEIEDLKNEFFSETNPSKKTKLKKHIDDKLNYRYENSLKTFGYKIDFDFKMVFSEVFHHKGGPVRRNDSGGGFDVVISNPPYGADIPKKQLKQIKKQIKDTNNSNSAALFIDFAKNRFIHQKGIVTLIVPKSLLYSEKWYSLVKSLSNKTVVLIDVEKGFENVLLEQVVFVYCHAQSVNEYQALKFDKSKFIKRATIPISIIKSYKVWLCDVSEQELEIANKMMEDALFLSEISSTIRGLPLQSKLKDKGAIPIIGGKDIHRYTIISTKGFVNKTDILTYSKKYKNLLQPKILSQNIVAHIENPIPHIKITSAVDMKGNILSVDTINNTFINDKHYSLLFILSILNSGLISWYTYRFIYGSAIRTMHFDDHYIGKIPIPKQSRLEQKPLISIVEKILPITEGDDYLQNPQKQSKIKSLEVEIDQLVYKLYALTPEEIKVVEVSVEE
ncbi:MAG TPA: class I SAM-dependent DNA methyltransferase, partial [candidate division Zixibacteria bacterium]|nr:class I SAM-dependent DNA methyltransferase [candidate division Zixibacteria bacterium]